MQKKAGAVCGATHSRTAVREERARRRPGRAATAAGVASVRRSVHYGAAPSQTGDLHLPGAGARWPVVCLLHGGFWRMPHGREQMDAVATDLVARGVATWNIGYRRIGEPGGGWPDTLHDIAKAIDHLAAIAAEEPRLDLRRVAVVGHSAGGQLALCVAARGARDRRFAPVRVLPAAACALAGVLDLERAFEIDAGRGAVAEFLGGTPQHAGDRYALASPRRLLPLGVPQLILHGAADTVLPPALSQSYVHAARRAGDCVDHEEMPHAGHMDYLDPSGAAHHRLCAWLGRTLHDASSGARR